MTDPKMKLQPESGASIRVEPVAPMGQPLGTATGFMAIHKGRNFFVTNRHVVTGIDQYTKKTLHSGGAVPSSLNVHLHSSAGSLNWRSATLNIVDGNFMPLWFEHPVHGASMDVIAIPVQPHPEVRMWQYEPASISQPELTILPSDPVSIIGFPFGASAAGLPIWTTGFIATELAMPYDNMPVFLVDCRARKGQSGSPVVAVRNPGTVVGFNGMGAMTVTTNKLTKFLGVYSGRINEQSDLGRVWKASAIAELLDAVP